MAIGRCVLAAAYICCAACGDDGGGGSAGGWTATGPSPDDCGDTASDTFHCGACGHTCWGGACKQGVCQSVSVQRDIKAVGDGLAVFGDGHSVENGVTIDIYVQPLASYFISPKPIAVTDDLTDDRAMAIADGFVYWNARDGLYRVDEHGGVAAQKLLDVTPATGGFPPFSMGAIAVSGTSVLASVPITTNAEAPLILRCPITGCASGETIYTGTVGVDISNVVFDGTYVAWVEGTDVRGCEVASCMATARTLGADVVNRATVRFALAIGDHKVAWANDRVTNGGQAALLCDYSDCSSPIVLLPHYTYDLTLHGGSIYIDSDTAVQRCPLTGCGSDAETLPIEPYNERWFITDDFYVHGNGKAAR